MHLTGACYASPNRRQGVRKPDTRHSSAASEPKLLDQVRETFRARHYSNRTEKSYGAWVKRFIFFHGKRHPLEMGEPEIKQLLTALAVDKKVSEVELRFECNSVDAARPRVFRNTKPETINLKRETSNEA